MYFVDDVDVSGYILMGPPEVINVAIAFALHYLVVVFLYLILELLNPIMLYTYTIFNPVVFENLLNEFLRRQPGTQGPLTELAVSIIEVLNHLILFKKLFELIII